MALRGALNPGLNLLYALALVIMLSFVAYSAYDIGALRGGEVLLDGLAFLVGLAVGMPAYFMNRRAIFELRDTLENKVFLSSQLALLDSRHGKNALVYFYFAIGSAALGSTLLSVLPQGTVIFLALGAYFSANLLPFVLVPKPGRR